jgi:hypothetical protein
MKSHHRDLGAVQAKGLRTRAEAITTAIHRRIVIRGNRMAGDSCQSSFLDYPFHAPASSGARMSGSTMIDR